ncbi:MAG: hypothetical protein AAFO69_08410 [Bacteroidota bacterium]
MKPFFTVILLFVIALVTYRIYQNHQKEVALRTKGQLVYAEIIDVDCGRQDLITFRMGGKEVSQRIYLNDVECAEVMSADQIGLRVGRDGTIVFDKNSYNDSAEIEGISILLLGAMFMFCAFHYGILSDILAKRKKAKK